MEELKKPGLVFLFCMKALYCQIILSGLSYNLFFLSGHLLPGFNFFWFSPDGNKDFERLILISNISMGGLRPDARHPPNPLPHSPSAAEQSRENITKDSCVEIRNRRGCLSNVTMGKTDSTQR